MKYLVLVLIGVGLVGLGWILAPNPPPKRPPRPTKTVVIDMPIPSIPERVQEFVFTPGTDVPVLVPYQVEVFLPDTIPCEEITSRTRIMSAEFGESYGDTSSVALEKMSYVNGSLVFLSRIERLYTDGMPKRIWTDSEILKVEWVDFPVMKTNSCSIFTKAGWGLIGAGGIKLVEAF